MKHSMFKKVLGELGKVMIRIGTHLLLHSHKSLALIQQENTVNGFKTKDEKNN